jgi:nuclear pore complex protein Nup188
MLNYKQQSPISKRSSLLEQTLCSLVTTGTASLDAKSKVDLIEVLTGYVKSKMMGESVRYEAVQMLYSLCASIAMSQPLPPTIVGHLSDPEATVNSFVRTVQHPYDELALRIAVWNFNSFADHEETALADLFITATYASQLM